MTRELTPLADAVLSLLRGEDEPLDSTTIYDSLLTARRYGAYADLDAATISTQAVCDALGDLEDAGHVASDSGGVDLWRWVPVVSRPAERQGCLFGE